MNTLLAAVETQFAARLDSEQRMRQFLADASHELRTPLTSIRGYAELARMQRAAGGQPRPDNLRPDRVRGHPDVAAGRRPAAARPRRPGGAGDREVVAVGEVLADAVFQTKESISKYLKIFAEHVGEIFEAGDHRTRGSPKRAVA